MRFGNLYRATWRYFGLGAALLSTVMNLVSPSLAAEAQKHPTATPIQHVIVIIGENRTFDHAAQGEIGAIQIIAIESDDCRCRAAAVGHRYRENMRIFPREVRLFAGVQLRQASLLCAGAPRRGTPQSKECRTKVRRASGNRVDGPRSGGTVGGVDDRRYGGRDQAAVS